MPNTFRLTGFGNVKQLLTVFWGISYAGNVQRRHRKDVAIPSLVKKGHVVRVICKHLWEWVLSPSVGTAHSEKGWSLCTYLSTIGKLRWPRFLQVISRIRFEDVE